MTKSNVFFLPNADRDPVPNPNWPRMRCARFKYGVVVRMKSRRWKRQMRLDALKVIDERVSELRKVITYNEGLLAGQRSQLRTLTNQDFRLNFDEVREWLLRIEEDRRSMNK
jgi:hypothetical protein